MKTIRLIGNMEYESFFAGMISILESEGSVFFEGGSPGKARKIFIIFIKTWTFKFSYIESAMNNICSVEIVIYSQRKRALKKALKKIDSLFNTQSLQKTKI